jgi:uncharacterized protein
MEEVLHRFNPWWDSQYPFPGVIRKQYLSRLEDLEKTRDVVLVTGLRRVGKTTLLHQLIHRLLNKVKARNILYVSLDNLAFRDHSILDVVESFRRLSSLKHDEFVYLFLDEVHFKEDYELQLKNLYDMGHAKIYASGSASLDIIMKSPHLTGRQRIMRLTPLSFSEYLKFTGKEISPADRHLYPALAREYIETGGMPEYVKTRDPNVLQSLLDSILYRDIAARYNIRNREGLKDILLFVAQGVSSPVSVRKISRILGIKEETVRRILDLFVESGLIHIIEKEGKLSERKASPKKLFLADTGLFTVLTENVNFGARVENMVYLTLAKLGNVRYYRTGHGEVDFVQGKRAVESKYKNEIRQEDIRAIKKLRGFQSRILVTENREGVMEGIELVPLWSFLLTNEVDP